MKRASAGRRQILTDVAQAGLAWVAAGSMGGVGLAAAQPAAKPEPPEGRPTPDSLRALLQAQLVPGGVALSAAWVDAQGPVLASAQRPGLGTPVPEADARFEYGSITKTFTALLLADAVVRGELKLDDPVEAALPRGLKLRDSAQAPITWADLATHRSGLPRLPANLLPGRAEDPYADYGDESLLAFVERWRAERPRDQTWVYSNLGFGLLGQALAWRAGRPYEALLRQRVLDPLGLTDVALSLTGRDAPRLQGHDAQGRAVPAWHFQAMAGAGALVGSARSLARYAAAATGLLSTPLDAAFRLALTPRAAAGANVQIGLAWLHAPVRGRSLPHHDGATFGFSTVLWLDPQQGRAALVLANAMQPVKELGLHLLDPAVPLRQPSTDPAQAVPADQLAGLAGHYSLNADFAIDVRVRDGRLFAQATGQGEFELFARNPRSFFARVTPLEVQFDGESGPAPAFTLLQGGQRLRFERRTTPPPEGTGAAALALSPAQLAPLAGRYALDASFAIELRLREGRLFAQATGQGEFELFARNARLFFARVTALEIQFEGADGPPPAFELRQAGQRLRFVRQ